MKLILFLSSLFLLACYGDYNDNTCGILSLCGLVLCVWNPSEGIEDEASMQDSSITEQGIG